MERERTPGPHVTEQPRQGLVLYAQSMTVGVGLGSSVGESVGSGVGTVGLGDGIKLGSGAGSDGVPVGLGVGQGGTIEQGVVEEAQPPQRLGSTACGDPDVTSVHFLLMICIPRDGTSPAAMHVLEHPVLAASMH